MKKRIFTIGAAILVTASTATVIWGHSARQARESVVQKNTADWIVAGAGRVEPESEDIKLGAELSGKLKSVYVEEGDRVKQGQLLAELENADYHAQVASAQAEVHETEAQLRKVVNGARREERREALSTVEQARAVMNNSESEMLRRQKLYEAGVISREEAEQYAKEYDVAKAKFQEVSEHHKLVDETAREEDRDIATANLLAARARLEQAQAMLAKTFVRSPIEGTVLRKHHRLGESVSNGSTVPDPIVTIGATERLRVRVDVDEADVSKLTVGQKAYVTADAYGDKRFRGHIVRIGQELGRKNVRTDEPTERVDMKILETMIELDGGDELPIGLRVNTFIVPKS
ncbi:secretion protein HlyD [Candidatus Koribacter versatilis Ellin345]|uniref:Secretion protein HlyD n=1 Tax=Koribacter versatilis (strain Ellin345) TaxID=204669 RepID=Q1IJC9_KORVE|nr:HlyD family efflux transporter periplasmic adaptor subunit [Candidatus Koribacter versatilis]ABF43021.1 secretion protein HlyD [Candidatus Koribacter versatilis Ellin345]